ncbi:PEP-CTERM sorting domain-containing protein [Microcystis aeruginosa]
MQEELVTAPEPSSLFGLLTLSGLGLVVNVVKRKTDKKQQ